jgi:hypothetical protein
MRLTIRRLTLAFATAALGACASNDPTGVGTDQQALDAAAQFETLATDALNAGADPDVWVAYRDIGRALLRTGRVSPVTIAVDGVPMDFLATAQQTELDAGPTCSQPGSLCLLLPPLRSVIAWQRDNPRRVVQLTASAGTGEIGRMVPGTIVGPFLNVATLAYFDGAGGVFVGTSGTQSIGDPTKTDIPCYDGPPVPSSSALPNFGRCTRADFTASVNGTVAPPPFAIRNNTASGTHTVVMAPQTIHGARIVFQPAMLPPVCDSCAGSYPPGVLPPVNLRGDALPSTLQASVAGNEVTFTFKVTNPKAAAELLKFNSSQQFDIRVRRADSTSVWTWSETRSFLGALTSRSIASGETITYTGTWTPTVKGTLYAEAWLTSSSHHARAQTAIVVP